MSSLPLTADETLRSVIRPLSRIIFVSLIAAFLLEGCRALPRQLPWKYPGVMENRTFRVYAQPGLRPEQYTDSLTRAARAHARLRAAFFGNRKMYPVNLVLFKDYKSYQAYVRRQFSIELIAHYRRDIRAVFIARESGAFVWRHELTHALLESLRPGTEFWLHEGLALFAQHNELPGEPSCSKPFRASMPPGLQASLHTLRNRKQLTPFKTPEYRKENKDLFHNPAVAGYFVFFLWSRRELTPLLKRYLADSSKPAHRFLPGFENYDINKTSGKKVPEPAILRDFRRWLKTKQPAGRLAGC